MNLYVGNLSYQTTDVELQQGFGAFGTVLKATVVQDRETGRSKGFGFVEMASEAEGQAAIAGMNGKELSGRKINVNEARPREDKPRGGNGGGFNRGGGRSGGNRNSF